MTNRIKTLQNRQELCEMYVNFEETDKFTVGYILATDNHFFLAEVFDPYGRCDGVFCALIDNVIQLKTNTRYLFCMEELISHNAQMRNQYVKFEKDLLNSFLQMVNNRNIICAIELCESDKNDITGYISKINKSVGTVELELINQYGAQDGNIIVKLDTISYISCDSLDETKLEILHERQVAMKQIKKRT